MKTFFTSDLHLQHKNIIKFCNRPFKSIEHMNKELIRRWNARVREQDIVIHNGDFLFRGRLNGTENAQYFINKLNGSITFIKGNHDRKNSFHLLVESLVVNYKGKKIFVIHDPRKVDTSFEINLVGHVHEKWQFCRIDTRLGHGDFGEYVINESQILPNSPYIVDCINTSCDVWDFYPRTLDEMLLEYYKWRAHYES